MSPTHLSTLIQQLTDNYMRPISVEISHKCALLLGYDYIEVRVSWIASGCTKKAAGKSFSYNWEHNLKVALKDLEETLVYLHDFEDKEVFRPKY